MAPLCPNGRVFHLPKIVASSQPPCRHWRDNVGLLQLLCNPNCRRAYLEAHRPSLYPSHHRRPCLDIQRQVALRGCYDGILYGDANPRQPRANDLLLPVRYGSTGHSMGCRGNTHEKDGSFCQVYCRSSYCRTSRCGYQRNQPIPYL